MVSSNALKTAFVVFTVIALILTLVAFFTPHWKGYSDNKLYNASFGLLTYDCDNQTVPLPAHCQTWWDVSYFLHFICILVIDFCGILLEKQTSQF